MTVQHTIPLVWEPKFLVFITVVACILFLIQRRVSKSNSLPLPPKPPGWPILGNTLEFIPAAQKGQMHLLLQKWAEQCGEIMRVQVGPTTNIYLNSDAAVKAIMDKASAQTSERPRWIVSNELLCNGWNLLLLNASDARWKLHRKITNSAMTSIPMADEGVSFLHYETAKFLHEVAHDPLAGLPSQDLWTQLGRYTYSTFAMQAFGFSIPSGEDPAIQYIHETGKRSIVGTLPGSHIVDILPFLNRLPLWLKPWERKARAYFQDDLRWVRQRMVEVQKSPVDKSSSMLLRILRDEKRLGMSCDDEAAFLGLNMIIGAADTSRMSTWSFMEAMMRFPDVQKEAQAEIDKLVGDRMPVWEDLLQSQYFRALMKEVWRWRPPVALGHPHTTLRDIEYEGMLVPKGSRIHLNAWAIHHDGRRHPDPERFDPHRYMHDSLTTQQSLNLADPTQRDHFAFGAGRRVCPGMHVAERSLGVAMMRILWSCNIKPQPDAKLPLDPLNYPGFMPGNPGDNMPVCMTVRNENRRRQIDEAWSVERQKGQSMGITGGGYV